MSSSSGTSRRVSLSLFFYMNRRLNVVNFIHGVACVSVASPDSRKRSRAIDVGEKKRTRKRSKRMRRVFNRAFLGFDALILVREYRWKFANHRAH